jgi:hypothetical protein
MAEDTPTRTETVTANNAATIAKYGPEAWSQIYAQLLTDISVSLAMLVDAGSNSGT